MSPITSSTHKPLYLTDQAPGKNRTAGALTHGSPGGRLNDLSLPLCLSAVPSDQQRPKLWCRQGSAASCSYHGLDVLQLELDERMVRDPSPLLVTTSSMPKTYGMQVSVATANDTPSLEETAQENQLRRGTAIVPGGISWMAAG